MTWIGRCGVYINFIPRDDDSIDSKKYFPSIITFLSRPNHFLCSPGGACRTKRGDKVEAISVKILVRCANGPKQLPVGWWRGTIFRYQKNERAFSHAQRTMAVLYRIQTARRRTRESNQSTVWHKATRFLLRKAKQMSAKLRMKMSSMM